MKYDIVVGNPPYGMGQSEIHLSIMKTVLDFCKAKLCFIMPSKPITQQLKPKWYSMFKNAVCTDVEVVDKSVFKDADMDNTAIYYCDRNTDPEDYCKKFDVDDNIYNMLSDEGKMFIDKMNKMPSKQISYMFVNKYYYNKDLKKLSDGAKDDYYYLNVNRAGIKPGNGEIIWLSGTLKKVGILTKDEEIEFCKNHTKRKNILECPSKEYGENLKSLMTDGKVLRFGLWLLQKNQEINNPEFKYVPDIDYSMIHNDSDLLKYCGFTESETKVMLDYLRDFNFSQNRNKIVRDYEKNCYI